MNFEMMSKIDVICDHSQKDLEEVPRDVLDLTNLQMLYLGNNSIEYLPLDIFQMLPRLTWLDLRDNKLKEIPVGVAYHECLDTLLVENNQLEELPNELGLCPNLLVLHINGNPLTYPSREILDQGAIITLSFLKAQFEKENSIVAVPMEDSCSEHSLQPEMTSSSSEAVHLPSKKKISVQELLRKASAAAKLLRKDTPVMTVKSLSSKNSVTIPTKQKVEETVSQEQADNLQNKKKLAKYCPKLSINSHYNSNKYLNTKKSRPNKDRVIDQHMKDAWLSKLKELLEQQEKLLQQERNLKALNSWRLQKKVEPLRKVQQPKMEVPYDTDPEYETMVQREQLCKEIDTMVRKKKRFTKTVDMSKLMSELVLQLKEMDIQNPNGSKLQRRDQEIKKLENCIMDVVGMNAAQKRVIELAMAETEIKRIIDLHKKVTSLQAMNNSSL